MSQRLVNTVVFVPGIAGSGTLTFSDFTKIELKRVQVVTNVTDGVFLFHFADSTLGGVVANNVLTLDTNTDGMDSGDAIQVLYNYEEGKTETAHAQHTSAVTTTLKSVDSGKKILVTSLAAFSDDANTTPVKVTFKVGTNIIRQHAGVAPGSGFIETGAGPGGEIVEGADGENLTVTTDGTEKVDLHGSWQEVTA